VRASGTGWRTVATQQTDGSGVALFRAEPGGRYRVRFAGLPGITAASALTLG
jgi:hypothetical protein